VTYVSGIERGRRNVSIDILHRLAEALGIEVRDLF
jgi:transcriptional regulator with XRE-family HTH domain